MLKFKFTGIALLWVEVTFLILLPLFACGQKTIYTLTGIAKATFGDTYVYKVTFKVNGSSLHGYSITKQPDGSQFKAEVTGRLNRKDHTFNFTEVKSLDKDPHNGITICLFDAHLTYKPSGAKYIVAGSFTGHDIHNRFCSTGTMELEQPNTPGSVFYTKKKAPPPPSMSDSVKKEPAPKLPENTITAGVQKEIDWEADSCILNVWDGGVIDGDVVSILLNDKPVLRDYTLEKNKKRLTLPLPRKINTITIIAGDEGANPPNTAEISLSGDGSNGYYITAFNKKGEKAVIVLKKK